MTGGSTIEAIERIREEGLEVAGVIAVVDRLAGGAEVTREATSAPTWPSSPSTSFTPSGPDRP